MGTWGPAILSNDYAEDIKESWKEKLGEGVSPEDASLQIIDEFNVPTEFSHTEDEYEFWLSLSLIQWKTGRLQENVKIKTLSLLTEVIIDKIESERWFNKSDYKKRIKHLEKLKKTLQSPQPKAKKIPKPFHRKSILKEGDIITIKIKSEDYILLEIVCIDLDHQDEVPRAVLLNYLSKIKPTENIVKTIEPLTLREFYNHKTTRIVNGKIEVEYGDKTQNQFDLWATSRRYDEPIKRIEFVIRNRKSKIKRNSDGICLDWKDIDETPLKWLTGGTQKLYLNQGEK